MTIQSIIGGLVMLVAIYWQAAIVLLILAVAIFYIGRSSWPRSLVLIPAFIAVVVIVNMASWHTYRYKLTVDLDVDGQTVSKSEVYEIRKTESPLRYYLSLGGDSGDIAEAVGEAIYFDLGSGPPLLVTMQGPSGLHIPTSVVSLAEQLFRVDSTSPVLRKAMKEGVARPVPVDELPRMITFRDRSDPNSVQLVDPKDMRASLGRNVSVKSASLQMTTERPGKRDLPNYLPWVRTIDVPFPSTVKNGFVRTQGMTFSKRDLLN